MWQGQAPAHEYCPERCHYTFRWWYEYSGGIMTDWGAHHMDIVHWALDVEKSGPITIDSRAEMPDIPNGYNTPAKFSVKMTYPNDVLVEIGQGDNGVLIEGDQGRIFVNRGRLSGKPVEDLEHNPLPDDAVRVYASDHHMQNFFDCMRTRKAPASDVFSHHRSISACHLANISMRLGRKLEWDAVRERFVGDDEADAMLARTPREGYEFA
jgi:predicted dehydrogenase